MGGKLCLLDEMFGDDSTIDVAYNPEDPYDQFVTLVNGVQIMCFTGEGDIDKKPWDKGGFKLIEGATVDMDMKMALVHHPVHDKYFIICRGTNQKEINNVIQAVDDAPEYPEALAQSVKWQESHTVEATVAHSQGCALSQRFAGKKMLVYPWRVEKQFLVEPAMLIFGAKDEIAGEGVSGSNLVDGCHEGLKKQSFDTNHDIDQNGQILVKEYKDGDEGRRTAIQEFFAAE